MSQAIDDGPVGFDGPIIMVGFGSVGSGLLPLIKRHFKTMPGSITVIDPKAKNQHLAAKYGAHFLQLGLTQENHRQVLDALTTDKSRRAYIVSVCNEVSSRDLADYAARNNAFYIDTVIEPWPGFYFNAHLDIAQQTNYALREAFLSLRKTHRSTPTAISCCGANPGAVSWFVKQALVNLAKDLGHCAEVPRSRMDWARIMYELGVKGIHIAERDTQAGRRPRPTHQFLNTWSAEGCQAEVLQPAELGWGTHEARLPDDALQHANGCGSAIYLNCAGGRVKVRTWTPTAGPHFGYLITHNESISISDYFTHRENEKLVFRPTCHYAYHPCETAVESIEEMLNERHAIPQSDTHVLEEEAIVGGADELGVLLYGHRRGAYWYGSRLTIEEARQLAPHQNATGLQVSSALLAGMLYAIKHPNLGILEAEDLDYQECLAVQQPYLGRVFGAYTDWNPGKKSSLGPSEDCWQFEHFRFQASKPMQGLQDQTLLGGTDILKPAPHAARDAWQRSA